jgi:hypothetical protein
MTKLKLVKEDMSGWIKHYKKNYCFVYGLFCNNIFNTLNFLQKSEFFLHYVIYYYMVLMRYTLFHKIELIHRSNSCETVKMVDKEQIFSPTFFRSVMLNTKTVHIRYNADEMKILGNDSDLCLWT